MPAQPPAWDDPRLEADRQIAIQAFREERVGEPLAAYLANFDRYRDAVENLLETTADLATLAEEATNVLADADMLYASRYLSGPPLSEGDLKILAQTSLAPGRIRSDPESAQRIVETILLGLDRERFPWLSENREPSEIERRTAIVASAALIATQRVQTERRNDSASRQQALVRASLAAVGFVEDRAHDIPNFSLAPAIGHFCGESVLGTRKADLVVRLWDGRIMPIECKVSNTEVNSIKRLSGDAALKARVWIDDFGRANVVPCAMMAGVFAHRTLKESQDRGLTLFWSHSLAELTGFISATRP